MTLQEKSNMESAWRTPWAPSDLIEMLIGGLEECFILAKCNKLAYIKAQMIEKALTATQSTGLFPLAVLEWDRFSKQNKTWPEFKSHFNFIEAYEIWLTGGASTTACSNGNGYLNATNTQDSTDDSSVWPIQYSSSRWPSPGRSMPERWRTNSWSPSNKLTSGRSGSSSRNSALPSRSW